MIMLSIQNKYTQPKGGATPAALAMPLPPDMLVPAPLSASD